MCEEARLYSKLFMQKKIVNSATKHVVNKKRKRAKITSPPANNHFDSSQFSMSVGQRLYTFMVCVRFRFSQTAEKVPKVS